MDCIVICGIDGVIRLDMLLLEFVKWMLRKKKHIVKLYWPFLVLIGIFGVFVKWNGGIVVGKDWCF